MTKLSVFMAWNIVGGGGRENTRYVPLLKLF